MFYTYVLRSLKDGKLYTGFSPDLRARLKKHRAGKVLATKNRLPVDVIYYEAYINERDARERERYLKTGWGRNYVHKILKNTLQNGKLSKA